MPLQHGPLLAAVDLGSNHFRLEIARVEDGRLQRVEHLKETVRQGGGLDAQHHLTSDAMERGWACLARFGERLAGLPAVRVRAVATQTLREARNRDVFLARGQELLGYPIDVIAGTEEARLIYLGVAHHLPASDERRLVLDIGGRSTELVLGQGLAPSALASFEVGSIAWSQRYFPRGDFTAQAFQDAQGAAQSVLAPALRRFGADAWDAAYGCAGTVSAMAGVLRQGGAPAGLVTRSGLDQLHERLLQARNAHELRMEGLPDNLRPVIGGGVSVLRAVLALLQIDRLHVAQGALRHGVLYELWNAARAQSGTPTHAAD